MNEITRPMLAVYAAAAIAIALIGARYLKTVNNQPQAGSSGNYSSASQYSSSSGSKSGGGSGTGSGASGSQGGASTIGNREVVVYVSGAVRKPGLVTLGDNARVGDAIRHAGGPQRGADLTAVNLAMHVADGQQVIVPRRGGTAGVADSGTGGGGGGSSGSTGPISLNTATAEQLDQLDGVGPGLAAKIIAARQQRGGFASVEDLADVPGIGDKRLASLRSQLQP